MKVLLEEGVWLMVGWGDPPRTLIEKNGENFVTLSEALKALTRAREFCPFKGAKIQNIPIQQLNCWTLTDSLLKRMGSTLKKRAAGIPLICPFLKLC